MQYVGDFLKKWKEYKMAFACWIIDFSELNLIHPLRSSSLDSLPITLTILVCASPTGNGQLLYEILPEQGGRHAVLSFEVIPQCMKDATVAVEDKNFYTNPGVDFQGNPPRVVDQPARR